MQHVNNTPEPFCEAVVELVEAISARDPEAVALWVAEWYAEAVAELDEAWEPFAPAPAAP